MTLQPSEAVEQARRIKPVLHFIMWCAICSAQTAPVRELPLVLGRGELLQFDRDVAKVAVAEPKIADAIVLGPREVMVSAKGIGKTTVVIWETGAVPTRYDVNVHQDTADW